MPKSRKNHKKFHRHRRGGLRSRNTRRKLKGGSYGSDIRQQLVTLCKKHKWHEYDALTQKIMKDYWVNGKKDFFIHLDRNITTFNPETLSCLKIALTQLQEDAIPESMPHLYYVMKRV
jgi:hypothetical protein